MSAQNHARLNPRPAPLLRALLLSVLLLMGTACTQPMQDDRNAASDQAPVAQAPAEPASEAAPPAVRDSRTPLQAPPMSDPLPPLRVPNRDAARAPRTAPTPTPTPAEIPARVPVKVDASCKTNADCTVKNVGNCCGYYPACVNVDSPTDPAGVQAQCAREGMMSVCGFPSISACQCIAGQCQGDSAAVER